MRRQAAPVAATTGAVLPLRHPPSRAHRHAGPVTASPGRHDLHRSPPVTLRQVRRRWPWLAPVALALVARLGLAAATHGGAALVWDGPLTRASVALRSPAVDRAALWVSRLGSTPVVFAAGAAGIALAARRCRSVALVMLVTITARPLVEWLLKELVARPRPTGARLVTGTGFSFPSGHVLAAAATWGFVPLIAALYVRRRWLWWMLTALSGVTIVLIAWSRVWLGVHWTSDVVGSLAFAFGALSVAEAAIDRLDSRHRRSPTPATGRHSGDPGPGEGPGPPSRSRGREADLGEDPVAAGRGRMDLDLVADAGI